MYHWFIIAEMKKEVKLMIREKIYRTKFEIDLQTCKQHESIMNGNTETEIGLITFCHDIFLKGELRQVFSTTYCLGRDCSDKDVHAEVKGAFKFGHSAVLTLRGNEIQDKQLRTSMIMEKTFSNHKTEPSILRIKISSELILTF